jgi:hypothetical protein
MAIVNLLFTCRLRSADFDAKSRIGSFLELPAVMSGFFHMAPRTVEIPDFGSSKNL